MILNNAPQNEAIVSNVAEIGEFRIRNSAKAFSILSSGLYANKVRAIIRELSCNAVDSHTAAGCSDTPFDVHLPNDLEPHFSIRDYGTGLTHEQVTSIYTTYFESTKTNSNSFIGALGLGSKSPFSYTDNFTVTAIKDGKKGIYSAFINGEGVPSIALMMSEDTTDPAGVEVKFSVNDRHDYNKFRDEARQVYTYFKLRPVVTGSASFEFADVEYDTENIIPGVHSYSRGRAGYSISTAIMGNIAYPISIPSSFDLGDVGRLLNCGLEMHFAIGELDFQASREGLSYIPQTVDAIKAKVEAVNQALVGVLTKEADAIPNLWDRALFLKKKKEQPLWFAAVNSYATDKQLPTFVEDKYGSFRTNSFKIRITELATRYNISLRGISHSASNRSCSTLKHYTEYSDKRNTDGHYDTWPAWSIEVNGSTHFVVNDLKAGAGERVKYHYRNTPVDRSSDAYHAYRSVFILEPADRSKPMKTDAFFAFLSKPPTDRIFPASALKERDRATGVTKNVTILSLQRRGGGGYRRDEDDYVWRDAGKADSFDATKTYYYIPLSGFSMLSSKGYNSGKELHEDVKSLPGLFEGVVYGVRKSDIEDIKKRANWKNFEDHITEKLTAKDTSKLLMSLVKSQLDRAEIFAYTNFMQVASDITDPASPFKVFVSQFANVEKFKGSSYNLDRLFKRFAPNANLSPEALKNKFQQELDAVNGRYPLLQHLNSYRIQSNHIADYINLVDTKKEGI